MTTGQAILLDHLGALLCVAAWFASVVPVTLRRFRLGLGLLVAAVLMATRFWRSSARMPLQAPLSAPA